MPIPASGFHVVIEFHTHIGSLRNKNRIEVPGYLKGNEKLEAIAKEGDKLNQTHKQQNYNLVRRMTQAMIDKERKEIRKDISRQMSANLTVGWKASSENDLQLQLNKDELASLYVQILFTVSNTKDLRDAWGFNDNSTTAWRSFCESMGVPAVSSYNDRINGDDVAVATRSADSLANI